MPKEILRLVKEKERRKNIYIEFTVPKPRGRPKKVVTILYQAIVYSILSEKEVGVVPDKEG
jgi:hypothetical protein